MYILEKSAPAVIALQWQYPICGPYTHRLTAQVQKLDNGWSKKSQGFQKQKWLSEHKRSRVHQSYLYRKKVGHYDLRRLL